MNSVKRIAFASDHAGFALKSALMEHVGTRDIDAVDFGTYSKERVDYNEFGECACRSVMSGDTDAAVLVCGTGMGMSIMANKIRGIRCAAVSDPYSSRLSKMHNNSNALALGERVVGVELAKMIVDEWLNAQYEPRHQHRLDKISELEERERRA
ncbi:ribose-5-phosphate isomerase B [Clostridia bacterium]|nr:ribose-5-phosphate isomerase B [Clostridia bacterium]